MGVGGREGRSAFGVRRWDGLRPFPNGAQVLNLASWLDVRENSTPAIAGAVHIAFSELPDRVHELPARQQLIQVADAGPEAWEALDYLHATGRRAVLKKEFEFGNVGLSRLWHPNKFLENSLEKIPVGNALELACGSGRDAVYLASLGYDVRAIDHLDDALELGRDLARRYLARPDSVTWVNEDLERPVALGKFDLVTCFYYLNRTILSKASTLLNPGGHLMVETFTVVHRQKFGKPKREHLVLHPEELRELAVGLEVLEYEEAWHEERHTARFLGRLL